MILAQFEIDYMAKPKNSRKAVPVKGKWRIVDDQKTVDNAHNLAFCCINYAPKKPFEGPLRVTYQFREPWRKLDLAKIRRGKLISNRRIGRSDLGNLDKQMDDVLERCGFYRNDNQITSRGVGHGKRWADQGGVSITIERDE